MKRIGLDLGSTTIKCVVLDEEGKILFHKYDRLSIIFLSYGNSKYSASFSSSNKLYVHFPKIH